MDGIINIYKEKGFTSHDVVAKMRGILHMKKIGHTGTLDPDATGVLPVCVGKGTRLCSLFEEHDKSYRAVLLLGRTTDTQDVTGATLKESEVSVSEEEVRDVIASFVGDIMQVPPMYSALKVNGKKLYEYARAGITIEREARPITISEIVIEEIDLPRITMHVSCSKGTYIRTLCNDIGEKLGCGGCMESLLRTRVGAFNLSQAVTLTELEKLRDEDRLSEVLLTVEDAFPDSEKVRTLPSGDKPCHNGNPLRNADLSVKPRTETIRLYDSEGNFIGLYERNEKYHNWKPLKMFI